MRLLATLSLFVACSPMSDPSPDAFEQPELAAPAVPPPLSLETSEPIPGTTWTLVAEGASPLQTVFFLRGSSVGAGPCPAALGGLCIALQGPSLLGSAVTDAQGYATLQVPIPAGTPVGASLAIQAVLPNGIASASSNALPVTIGATEYGPANDWDHALVMDVPPNLQGTGYSIGDVAHNWTFPDQNGDSVELYQFYGDVVLVQIEAAWSGPGYTWGEEMEQLNADYAADGLQTITVLVEDGTGSPPDTNDASDWANSVGVSYPVVADLDGMHYAYNFSYYPTFLIIDRDMRLIETDHFPLDEAYIASLL